MARIVMPLGEYIVEQIKENTRKRAEKMRANRIEHEEEREYEGCGQTQFNVYVTVKAKSGEKARKKIEKFFENVQGLLDYTIKTRGKKIEVTFDECFEVMDVIEKKKQ